MAVIEGKNQISTTLMLMNIVNKYTQIIFENLLGRKDFGKVVGFYDTA